MSELLNDWKATQTQTGTDSAGSALADASLGDSSFRPEADALAATDGLVNTGSGADTRADLDRSYGQLAAGGSGRVPPNALFAGDELHQFRSDWDQVQASFVDEPRAAVEHADTLVADVVNRITEQFATEREQLEKQWARGEDANTEALRQTFKRYRAFFDRLLSFKGDEVTTA